MKRFLTVSYVVLFAVVSPAWAGEMTPEKAKERVQNCKVCSAYSDYPTLGPNLRYDIFDTSSGFVASMMLADESLLDPFKECQLACTINRASLAGMSKEELRGQLCPFCSGMAGLMGRSDIIIEEFNARLGKITVARATTDNGVYTLHEYAKMARKTSDLLESAAATASREGSP